MPSWRPNQQQIMHIPAGQRVYTILFTYGNIFCKLEQDCFNNNAAYNVPQHTLLGPFIQNGVFRPFCIAFI